MGHTGTALFVSLFVGLFGAALFVYGRKQARPPHLLGGVLLSVFPWFVSDPLVIGGIAVAIVVLVAVASKLGV